MGAAAVSCAGSPSQLDSNLRTLSHAWVSALLHGKLGQAAIAAAANALPELLPGVDYVSLAFPAAPGILLATSNLVGAAEITLSFQQRHHTLAGAALQRGSPAACACIGNPAAEPWVDLAGCAQLCAALCLPVTLPGSAPAASCAGAAAPSPGSSAAACKRTEQRPDNAGPTAPLSLGRAREAAGALLLGARGVLDTAAIMPVAEALAAALAEPLAAAGPRVAGEVAPFFLAPLRCTCARCGSAGRAPASQVAPAATGRQAPTDVGPAASWQPGSCGGAPRRPPDGGSGAAPGILSSAGAGASSSSSSAADDGPPVGPQGPPGSKRAEVAGGPGGTAASAAASRRQGGSAQAALLQGARAEPGGAPVEDRQQPPGKLGGGAAAGGGARPAARWSWWRGFEDPAQERAFAAWQAASKAQADKAGAAVLVAVMLTCGFVPSICLARTVPLLYLNYFALLLLPLAMMRLCPAWYVRHREVTMCCLRVALMANSIAVGWTILDFMPDHYGYSLVGLLRNSFTEFQLLISLAFMVRMRAFVAVQAATWAMAASSLPHMCAAAAAQGAGFACLFGGAAVQLCVGVLLPAAVSAIMEASSRNAFAAHPALHRAPG